MNAVGIIANPLSGRDVRRYAARGSQITPEIKRDQVARAAIGAAAAGAEHIFVMREPFGVSERAVANLRIPAKLEVLDVGAALSVRDTVSAAAAMRELGCGALVVLGGDGTSRAVAREWPDVAMVPLSTGTNNVFPYALEATAAGAAAGLVATERLPSDRVTFRAKVVRVAIEGEAPDLALVDAVELVDDGVGNLMPFDAEKIRTVVLARAEPTAVGSSAIGGLRLPAGARDPFGVLARCVAHEDGGSALLVPIAPGLYRKVHVAECHRLELAEPVNLVGPSVLAFDGDRERALAPEQRARLEIRRDGPNVIEPEAALRLAAELELFRDRPPWHDAYDGAYARATCC